AIDIGRRRPKPGSSLFSEVHILELSTRIKSIRRSFGAHEFHTIVSRQPRSREPGSCTLFLGKFFVGAIVESLHVFRKNLVVWRLDVSGRVLVLVLPDQSPPEQIFQVAQALGTSRVRLLINKFP